MNVTLPADLTKQVEQELDSGCYQSSGELIEQAVRHFLDERQRGQRRLHALRRIGQAVRHFLDERQRGQRRLNALRRIGQAVDQAGLYERVLVPDRKSTRLNSSHLGISYAV